LSSHRTPAGSDQKMKCLALLLCFATAAGDCSWSYLVGAKTRSISAQGTFAVWASSAWVDTVKVMVSSDDDSVLTVYTQESRHSTQYYAAASAINTVCFATGSSKTVRSGPGPLYVIIECENLWYDCPIHYDIDFSCAYCSSYSPPTTTTTPRPSALSSCSSSDVAGAKTWSVPARGSSVVKSTSGWVTSVRIMVSSDDGSSIDVKTKTSRDASTYFSSASELNTGCFKTGSYKKVRNSDDPGQIYVIIECDNSYSDCPIHYDIDYLCEDCTAQAPASTGCSDSCFCETCTDALACEQAKCSAGETFESYGCSSSVNQVNGVTTSRAYVSGTCSAPSAPSPSTSAPSTSSKDAESLSDCNEDCACSTCSNALACEEAKCLASETFSSYGCSSSVRIYNGVGTSTASLSGECKMKAAINAASGAATAPLLTAVVLAMHAV